MTCFLLFVVAFATGFVFDNAGNFAAGLFMGIFLPLLLLFYKQPKGILEMFDGWKIINLTKFWLGYIFISSLGLFLERVIFPLSQ